MEFVRSLAHPEELCALFRYKFKGDLVSRANLEHASESLRRCYELLDSTSRTFAAVIRALDDELRDAVCLFYLVLRALDTVEDDMTITLTEKTNLLRQFSTFLEDPDWSYKNSKEKDRAVLEEFTTISSEFRRLKPLYRDVISDICQRMGNGMAVYLKQSPDSLQQWDEYCHYVAGLVGVGLTRLFSASRLEDAAVGSDTVLANSMGLFLQKTNIIRDYLEDVLQGRQFWPKQVWCKYSQKLIELSEPERTDDALKCLNELVTNALQHIPDVITYLSHLRNRSIFRFCAIPQVMAIATLERCYNNRNVFSGVVKIRKGEAVRLMIQATNVENVKAIFLHFTSRIRNRIPSDDPSAVATLDAIQLAQRSCRTAQVYASTCTVYLPIYLSFAMLLMSIAYHYWNTFSQRFTS